MRWSAYIARCVNRSRIAVSAVRWGDPLVQSWGLIGGLLVAGIVAHYAAGRGPGEQKNRGDLSAVFAAVPSGGSWRPAVVLESARAIPGPVEDAAAGQLDLRALAEKAATREGWRHVPPGLRKSLLGMNPEARQITVTWSHTPGGDARALSLYHQTTLGREGSLPYDFVIGNGRRSDDGRIDAQPRWSPGAPVPAEGSRICLTGQPGTPTDAQAAALGELITCLEARCGKLPLAMQSPEKPAIIIALRTR